MKKATIKQLLELLESDTDIDYKITRSCNGKMYISVGVDENICREIWIESIFKAESEDENTDKLTEEERINLIYSKNYF